MGTNTSPQAQNHLKALWEHAASYGTVLWDGLTHGQAVSKRQAAYALRARERKNFEASTGKTLSWDTVQITIIKSEEFPGMYALRFAKDYEDLPGKIKTADGRRLTYHHKLLSFLEADPDGAGQDAPTATASREPTIEPANPFDKPLAPGEGLGLKRRPPTETETETENSDPAKGPVDLGLKQTKDQTDQD